jgi:hypothetical protein
VVITHNPICFRSLQSLQWASTQRDQGFFKEYQMRFSYGQQIELRWQQTEATDGQMR